MARAWPSKLRRPVGVHDVALGGLGPLLISDRMSAPTAAKRSSWKRRPHRRRTGDRLEDRVGSPDRRGWRVRSASTGQGGSSGADRKPRARWASEASVSPAAARPSSSETRRARTRRPSIASVMADGAGQRVFVSHDGMRERPRGRRCRTGIGSACEAVGLVQQVGVAPGSDGRSRAMPSSARTSATKNRSAWSLEMSNRAIRLQQGLAALGQGRRSQTSWPQGRLTLARASLGRRRARVVE